MTTGLENAELGTDLAFKERAEQGVAHLQTLLGQTASQVPLDDLFAGWGHRRDRGAGRSRWDAPYEYSVAFGQKRAEVRLFLGPQAAAGPPDSLASWKAGWQALEALETQGVADLRKARRVSNFFRPHSSQSAFGMCLGAAVTDKVSEPKIYFDGYAGGVRANWAAVNSALASLGFSPSRDWAAVLQRSPIPVLSLDLGPGPLARSKLYQSMPGVTADQLEAVCSILPTYRSGVASQLVKALHGAELASSPLGPPPLVCWSLTGESVDRPAGITLYLPFNSYVPDGTDALNVLKALRGQSPMLGLAKGLVAGAGAPNPFHWISFKFGTSADVITLYASPMCVDPVVAGDGPRQAIAATARQSHEKAGNSS